MGSKLDQRNDPEGRLEIGTYEDPKGLGRSENEIEERVWIVPGISDPEIPGEAQVF